MRFALGVDGGATKTMAAVGDQSGRVLGVGLSGPSNYQAIGLEAAMANISAAVIQALQTASIGPEQIEHAVYGMAGADFPIDFRNLTQGIEVLYPGMQFELTNDTWVGFRAGTAANHGGVVICGTGANFAAVGPEGNRVTGRGMGYEWGGEGGAGSLIRSAVHFGFRSADGTGPKTALEQAVLQCLEFESYDDLSLYMYEVRGQFAHIYVRAAKIVPCLFQLAFQGDRICQDILISCGTSMGEIMGRMMQNQGMERMPSDVVMVGSVFTKAAYPLMNTSFQLSCQRFIPLANFTFPQVEPAGGGFLIALEHMGIDIKGQVRQEAIETFPALPEISGL